MRSRLATTVREALLAGAAELETRAVYFEARAGRGASGKTPPAATPIERARHERSALAFRRAAVRVQALAEEETT